MTEIPEMPTLGIGLHFEDYSVGQRFRTIARTVTETDIVNFIGVTGMTEVLFTDATFGKGVGAAGRVAPAALSYTLMEGLLCQTVIQGTGLALLEMSKKVLAPVVAGDTLHLEVEVLDARPTSKGGRGIVKARHDIVNQRGETVITYDATRMVLARGA
ncbi:MAG: MaoC/PaaZ C-terminal domain-containing protein [Rhodospirillaceae bacterium]